MRNGFEMMNEPKSVRDGNRENDERREESEAMMMKREREEENWSGRGEHFQRVKRGRERWEKMMMKKKRRGEEG